MSTAVWWNLLFLLYFCSTSPGTPFVLWMLWTGYYFFRIVLGGQGKRCVLVVYQARERPSSVHPQSKSAQTHGPKSGDRAGVGGTQQDIPKQDWDPSHTALPPSPSWVITAETHRYITVICNSKSPMNTLKNFVTAGTEKVSGSGCKPQNYNAH